MKVRMLTGLSGPTYSLTTGDEADFPDDEAIRLIEAGYAAPVERSRRETATKKPAAEKRAD